MMGRCLLLATYQPTHYFCLAFREQFLQQRLSHCHPTTSSSLGRNRTTSIASKANNIASPLPSSIVVIVTASTSPLLQFDLFHHC